MAEQIMALLATHSYAIALAAIFLAIASLTFVIGNITRSWADVRRRSAVAGGPADDNPAGKIVLYEGAAAGGTLDVLLPSSEAAKGDLRRLMNMAGYYGKLAPAILQLSRILSAVLLGLLTAANFNLVLPGWPFAAHAGATVMLALAGYMLPKTLVSFKRDSLIEQHRQGFPDFLDLLVICIEAGIGIDSAIERVGQDMARSYPSLSRNLQFMSLEMRAGRNLRDALENLSDRLGIGEARSFATLLQQSEELGSSLVQSLRVYSDEMRLKRLARAEEKAYALPAKLVIPLGLFIFPVILAIILTPVIIKIYSALGI